MGVESSGGPDGHSSRAAPRPDAPRRVSRLVDIAEAVGVHVSTVSRVLNGDPAQSIRPEIYERILDTARQQGYRPERAGPGAQAAPHRGASRSSSRCCATRSGPGCSGARCSGPGERGYVVMIMEEPTEDPQPPGDYRYLVEESRADGLLLATSLRVPGHAAG